MEIAPRYLGNPETLKLIYVSTSGGVAGGVAGRIGGDRGRGRVGRRPLDGASDRVGDRRAPPVSSAKETMVPLTAFARFETGNTPVQVSHQGLFVVPANSPWIVAGMRRARMCRSIAAVASLRDFPGGRPRRARR
jgi:multidrug efflux pump